MPYFGIKGLCGLFLDLDHSNEFKGVSVVFKRELRAI
nr:MAG TPA: hypothetical protein [Caudoviricetes sp.]